MTITRVQLVRNVGQFDSVSPPAELSLGQLTVVHAENGRGKTTLAAILRSLATGDPLPIAERRRLAAQNPPHVVVECVGGPPPAVFQNNAWNRTLSDLVVFDDAFVDQNVHSGLAVQAHHRQNLHELILGTVAGALSRQHQDLVAGIEEHNRQLRSKERAIPTAVRGPYSVDDFCGLRERPGIGEAIQEAERSLAGARDQDAVRNTAQFEMLHLPAFDLALVEGLLQRDLPALDSATLARVQAHLSSIGGRGEDWVADGMRRVSRGEETTTREVCPFCEQSLHGSPLIEHYRAYFSEGYASLKRDVTAASATIDRVHGGEAAAGLERAVRVTVERRQFWSRFCDVPEVTLDTASLVRDWKAAREQILAKLAAKQAAPLEPMQLGDNTRRVVATFDAHRDAIADINQRLQAANDAIAVAKERVVVADSRALEADVARLKSIVARHEPAVAAACEEYLQERAAKEATERQREETKAALERHRAAVFPGYQTAINLYLPRFNAGFRLNRVTYANTRGGPTCTYDVLINDTAVAVGGADPAPGQPSFRNTLSAGDRNTLALAFFFGSLDQDADLSRKVVVVDDPISSLDDHRALATVHEIRRLAERAAQVIVLSHNKPFLCRLWEGAEATARAAVEVVRDGAGSTLRSWDVSRDAITEHDRRDARLRDFITSSTGDLREVARSVRPHLEAFLRVASPQRFTPGTLLGQFRNLCQQRSGTADSILDQAVIEELDQIVEYANRFHHDTNPAWETEAVNDGELRGFVSRTLAFCRR